MDKEDIRLGMDMFYDEMAWDKKPARLQVRLIRKSGSLRCQRNWARKGFCPDFPRMGVPKGGAEKVRPLSFLGVKRRTEG